VGVGVSLGAGVAVAGRSLGGGLAGGRSVVGVAGVKLAQASAVMTISPRKVEILADTLPPFGW